MGKELKLANECFKKRFETDDTAHRVQESEAYYWFLLGWRDRSCYKEDL